MFGNKATFSQSNPTAAAIFGGGSSFGQTQPQANNFWSGGASNTTTSGFGSGFGKLFIILRTLVEECKSLQKVSRLILYYVEYTSSIRRPEYDLAKNVSWVHITFYICILYFSYARESY